MAMPTKWVACQTCRGRGTVERVTTVNGKRFVFNDPCPARCNGGKVNVGTI